MISNCPTNIVSNLRRDTIKAERLGWKAGKGIRDMVRDAWKFEQNNKGVISNNSAEIEGTTLSEVAASKEK